MGSIKLLDCTLRDGGYINDWRFGKAPISDIVSKLEESGVDILELGFIKNEPYQEDRTVFNSMAQIKVLLDDKKPDIQYAAMIEVVNPLPLQCLEPADAAGADIIRVIVWKKLLHEGFLYCKGVVEKGYKLCLQPARVDQYSEQEFINMVELFNRIDPFAVYVVDSWGTQYRKALLNYLYLLDKYLKPGVAIGYHGHNNMMQAFGVAEDFVNMDIKRVGIVDASIYGIGRGAGNLNTEIFAKYMNENHGYSYNITPMIEIYEKYISEIHNACPWGYSIPYYLTALHRCNPNYASYYGIELGLPATEIDGILSRLSEEDRIIYNEEKARKYLEQVRG